MLPVLLKRTAGVCRAYSTESQHLQMDSIAFAIRRVGDYKHTKINTDRTFVNLVSHVGCKFQISIEEKRNCNKSLAGR